MSHPQINNILILGGGTAGWMAAAAMSKFFAGQPVSIQLVESPELGTVGVGEATVPVIRQFNRYLGLDEDSFIRRTQGSFKLGIEFCDWLQPGSRYFHGFGDFGAAVQGVPAHQLWLRSQALGNQASLLDYCFAAQAARHNCFAPPPDEPRLAAIAAFDYAYHFDAGLYAQLLREWACERGVEHLQGQIQGANLDPGNGDVASVGLADGRTLNADFFIDCTGFHAQLMHCALQVPYCNWSAHLPCNRALALACERREPLTPYTRATARSAGWQWRIPLQHRVGNGLVYASDYLSDERAERELRHNLEGDAIGDIKRLRFTTGHREHFWYRNTLALGLAAGFLEPLESTSIQLIQTGLLRFWELLPSGANPASVQDEYNRITRAEYERLRDFLILHYCTNQRPGSDFWRYCREQALPAALAHKIAVFRDSGRVPLYDNESYSEASWVAILTGQNIMPQHWALQADQMPASQLVQLLEQRRRDIAAIVSKMPSHEYYLEHLAAH
ncbi:tryptophan halogenase family protein [Gilvimarinus xylanilyticus]|uniref:Tryptophan 7-halogenase n=1 Tax=Gilvimarinus xylanilyticus TaxID=2944139 RepID=A0A9X2I060_9GAMM|nr:tryptophan halogenase family protein [Gilvimarinus xylanilyticus]MCP8900994.1 tryptophan 7-halogenase [Gilvimarinus xylanilyticus]